MLLLFFVLINYGRSEKNSRLRVGKLETALRSRSFQLSKKLIILGSKIDFIVNEAARKFIEKI